jgi:serine/threonine protein kinase
MGRYGYEYLEPGALVAGRYRIVERVGEGDDVDPGAVYLARDERASDRPCAVEEIFAPFADERERAAAVEAFEREARRLAAFEHSGIATVFDHVVEPMHFYVVRRYVRGRTLEQEASLRGGVVDEAAVTAWAVEACDALAYLHERVPPFILRDLDLTSLVLDVGAGQIVLVDFGLARIVRQAPRSPHAVTRMGYVAPETFAGRAEPRTDVYSLGAALFHLLTGSDPRYNPLLVFDFTRNPRPRQLNPAITPEMDAILGAMVSHKPESRPSSADLKRVFEEHERRLGSSY